LQRPVPTNVGFPDQLHKSPGRPQADRLVQHIARTFVPRTK